MDLIKNLKPKARKSYDCMACEWLLSQTTSDLRRLFDEFRFTFTEKRQIINAYNNNYKIIKGQYYIRQTLVDNGQFTQFMAIPEIHEICCKYEIYEY